VNTVVKRVNRRNTQRTEWLDCAFGLLRISHTRRSNLCSRLTMLAVVFVLVLSTQLLAATVSPSRAGAVGARSADLGSQLAVGQTMGAGQFLQSPGGKFILAMQGDGNLVEYNTAAGVALWAPPPPSQTLGNPGDYAVLQADGNFVVYSQRGSALWASYTQGNPQDYMALQDDGNLVIYSGASPLWATMSAFAPPGNGTSGNYGAAGQCTWWAEQEAVAYTGVWPALFGDAYQWAADAAANGWSVGYVPRIGSVVVFQPGFDGAFWPTGHVAWVTEFYPDTGIVVISEMNFQGLGVVDSRAIADGVGNPGIEYIYMNP